MFMKKIVNWNRGTIFFVFFLGSLAPDAYVVTLSNAFLFLMIELSVHYIGTI